LKKTKVLHLIKSLGRGGAEKLIPQTAALHDKEKFEFYCLYFFHQNNNIVDELEEAGIKVFHIPSSNLGLFFQVSKVREFVKEHQIDIIHAHLPWAGILSRLAGKKMSVPIVYTEHNTWDRYNPFSYWGNRLTFKQQDAAIAVSNEVSLSMQLNLIFDPLKIPGRMKLYSIPNGVNVTDFQRSWEDRETIRKAWKIPQDAFVVGKVAVFRSQKRLWVWVEQALEILKKAPQTHFLLVGDGEWRAKILSQIKSSGKTANFHWAGVQKEVRPFLSAMDLYMSSSEFEGLPIAMLEAMACELPVVATRAGGIGEVITHGVEGFLCEIDQYAELSSLALKLIQDPSLHQSFSAAARKRVEEDFSMVQMVKELEKVYEEVLGEVLERS
jgi:glycosyltransferase involved in cell wall biosynthesis